MDVCHGDSVMYYIIRGLPVKGVSTQDPPFIFPEIANPCTWLHLLKSKVGILPVIQPRIFVHVLQICVEIFIGLPQEDPLWCEA